MRIATALLVALMALSPVMAAQTRRTAKPAPPPPPPRTEPAMMQCPAVLGEGVMSMRTFCDVLIGNDPAAGIIITLPPHTGDARLMFDLHNRHTYSAELAKTRNGFRRYTAGIGVMDMKVNLLSRAAVQSEFRTAADLFDRVSGSGPGGLKAVAPIGSEAISIVIPAGHERVSILGERLTEVRPDGAEDRFTVAGRPIAVVSNVTIEYRPAPPAPARRTTPAPAKRR